MLFTTWLQAWLSRHPLKGPSGVERARFTDEVMARVRALGLTSKEILAADPLRRWVPWPRFALAIATASATVALVVGVVDHSNRQLATGIARDARLLATLDERDGDLVLDDDVDILHDELAMTDTIVLAEQASSDEEWLAQTLELLDQLDEGLPSETASDGVEEDWLDELRLLDESDLPT
ncbi:MAG: hypothetical protein HYY59_03450 [Candidatus Omnitrophica bacterium]|nr:hypothetical protein [Candidatus Omnitrophota bacterium]MBI2496078.1 hypothetical protein [Candidatus Omnitrophota bacterium]MBI3021039.1 hypothetical protein [Candidatus Omnitrophota bacterium]